MIKLKFAKIVHLVFLLFEMILTNSFLYSKGRIFIEAMNEQQ